MSENKKKISLILLIMLGLFGLFLIVSGVLLTISPAIMSDLDSTMGDSFIGASICCFLPGGFVVILALAIWFFFVYK